MPQDCVSFPKSPRGTQGAAIVDELSVLIQTGLGDSSELMPWGLRQGLAFGQKLFSVKRTHSKGVETTKPWVVQGGGNFWCVWTWLGAHSS